MFIKNVTEGFFLDYQHIRVPAHGSKITYGSDRSLVVPDVPIIPFIEGDGVGVDVTPVMRNVVDCAVKCAYGERRSIAWMELFNGEKAAELYDGDWFPQETLDAIREYVVAIKGPLTTPVGGGFRSLNIAMRQEMDLYASVRPIKWIAGVPSPVTCPHNIDIVVFRENSEDIYAGIEWKAGSDEADALIYFLQQEMGVSKIRFPYDCAVGIKPMSKEGCQRLVRQAIHYALMHNRRSVTIVHKGNVMKFTEGGFKHWAYQVAISEFGAKALDDGSGYMIKNAKTDRRLIINDCIADSILQFLLLYPEDYDVIAATNLNGDYIADALTAQVGGLGVVPGANLNDDLAIFEPTHGTAQKYAGLDKVNPGSIILSAEMMLKHIAWHEAADLINYGLSEAIKSKKVTYDYASTMSGATQVSCSQFGDQIIHHIKHAIT